MKNIWEYTFFEINNADLLKLFEWGNLLMSRYKKEALKTMRYEHADFEAMYSKLIRETTKSQVVGVMHFYDEPRKSDKQVSLNQKHLALLKRVLHKIGSAKSEGIDECLYKFVDDQIVYELSLKHLSNKYINNSKIAVVKTKKDNS